MSIILHEVTFRLYLSEVGTVQTALISRYCQPIRTHFYNFTSRNVFTQLSHRNWIEEIKIMNKNRVTYYIHRDFCIIWTRNKGWIVELTRNRMTREGLHIGVDIRLVVSTFVNRISILSLFLLKQRELLIIDKIHT